MGGADGGEEDQWSPLPPLLLDLPILSPPSPLPSTLIYPPAVIHHKGCCRERGPTKEQSSSRCQLAVGAILRLPASHCPNHRLVGLLVKASASRAEDPGFESRLRRDFSASSHTSDSKIGTPVATLPGAWRYRVSNGTGRPGVSIL